MSIDSNLVSKICEKISNKRQKLISEIQRLVQIPSIVGSEGKYQEYVAELFDAHGLSVEIFEPDLSVLKQHPAYVEVPWTYEGRPNVIGTLKGKGSGRSLILNAHADVVSPEPVGSWKYSPWSGQVVGNRLYGRGAADMKAGLASILVALDTLTEMELFPKGDIQVQSVIEEEAGGGGTLACLLKYSKADAMVIPEPGDKIAIAHAGVLYFRVKVKGKTAHAGVGHVGVNAIEKMNVICNSLIQLDAERGKKVKFDLFERNYGRSCHLNLGTYKAGDWPSTVAGWAEIECRISFTPDEKLEAIKEEVKRVIEEAAAKDSWLAENSPELEWFGWHTDPWMESKDSDLIKEFSQICRLQKLPVEFTGKTSAQDTRFGQYFGIPSLSYGSKGYNIHGVDEWVDIDSVVNTTKVLANFIVQWCC